ncbi:MAG: DNA-directed RNA polymerase subunit alpha [Thermoanaerobaculia bacterium]|nr:DNA-directed RNA polymerase subunit alpha [Thermoanaerobaculia bacterium]
MMWAEFQKPKKLEYDTETLTSTYGRFIAQPFERGFGTTIGNALRRVLLSSIEGAAVTAVKVEGVLHEFSSLNGVVEDMTDIVLNLKQIPFKLHSRESKTLFLEKDGPGEVTAADFEEDADVEILDPSAHIATLSKEGSLKMEVRLKAGRGYVVADLNADADLPIGYIPIDSIHSPVRRVNFHIEGARVGQTTDYDRLVLEVWTNGAVPPQEALSLAARLLGDHLSIFSTVETGKEEEVVEEEPAIDPELGEVLGKPIEELDLSVRSANCLKNANIRTLGDLVQRSEREMLSTKNFGRKSLDEIKEVLENYGLEFGMNVRNPERREPARAAE